MMAVKYLGAALSLTFALVGAGCSYAYGDRETTKNAIVEKFRENGFSIKGTANSATSVSGILAECYTLSSIPDDGLHYTGCVTASSKDGIQITSLRNVNIPR